MNQDDLTHIAEAAATDLAEILWRTQAISIAESEERLNGYEHQRYPHLRPAVTRVAMREALTQETLPSGWRLGGRPQQSGQLLITNDNVELRFLKERSLTYPGGVPAAGSNNARQAWWRQPQLPIPELDGHSTPLSGIEPVRFLLLWDYLSPVQREDGFTLRIVHTTGAGKYGEKTPIDLSLSLEPIEGMESQLRFFPVDEDFDFFFKADERDATGSDGS